MRGVDARLGSCFSEWMPPKKKKTKDVEPEVDEALGIIEAAWRNAGHDSLVGLTFMKTKKETGIVPSSTWFGWRNGERSPKYVEIHRVSKALGLEMRPRRVASGVQAEPSEMAAAVARLIDRMPDRIRASVALRIGQKLNEIRAEVEAEIAGSAEQTSR